VSLAGQPADVAIPLLVREHGGRLYTMGLRFCGGREDAEDLVQQTFLQAFRKWDQFEGDSSPMTWLYTIAARVCQRNRRRRSGEPRRLESLDALLPSGERTIPELPSRADDPETESIKREARASLERAIPTLPASLRLPLVLKDIVELPVADVARVLGLKEATVKTRVHRARLALRRTLAERLPRVEAEPPGHARQVCLDLLGAKLDALDRDVPFAVPQDELCNRCRALFATLDLGRDACRQLGVGKLPPALRREILQRL
jgi:RNA polymerase sigma-70 factor (ECF subfamily)